MFRNIRTFTYVTTESDRNAEWDGWRMEGMPHFDPSAGLAVAHDSLEHMPNAYNDSLIDEMLAFGAIVRNRVRGGYWHSDMYWAGKENEVIASDILRFIAENRWYIRGCGSRMNTHVKELLIDRQRFIEIVRDEQYNEYDGFPGYKVAYDMYKHAMRWVSIGHRMAENRWHMHDPYEVMTMFRDIEKAVDNIKHMEPGDQLKVMFNIKDLTYRVIHTPYYELDENYF